MRVAWQRVGLAPAQAGERQHKPKREDGSRVSRKRQAAGRASYYQGEREALRCPFCQESVTAFFTNNLGRGQMQPACDCTMSQSCCYSCSFNFWQGWRTA